MRAAAPHYPSPSAVHAHIRDIRACLLLRDAMLLAIATSAYSSASFLMPCHADIIFFALISPLFRYCFLDITPFIAAIIFAISADISLPCWRYYF